MGRESRPLVTSLRGELVSWTTTLFTADRNREDGSSGIPATTEMRRSVGEAIVSQSRRNTATDSLAATEKEEGLLGVNSN